MTSRRQFESAVTTPNAAKQGFESVIGSTMVIEGQLVSTGPVRINGRISGPVRSTDRVSVSETAKIVGDIHAPVIEVAGFVEGNLNGQTVSILKGATVNGNITSPGLKMEEGALISGSLIMNEPFKMPDIEAAVDSIPPTTKAKN